MNLPPAGVAIKETEKGLSELSVHETIGDRITATGNISQELHKTNSSASNMGIDQFWCKEIPRIDDV